MLLAASERSTRSVSLRSAIRASGAGDRDFFYHRCDPAIGPVPDRYARGTERRRSTCGSFSTDDPARNAQCSTAIRFVLSCDRIRHRWFAGRNRVMSRASLPPSETSSRPAEHAGFRGGTSRKGWRPESFAPSRRHAALKDSTTRQPATATGLGRSPTAFRSRFRGDQVAGVGSDEFAVLASCQSRPRPERALGSSGFSRPRNKGDLRLGRASTGAKTHSPLSSRQRSALCAEVMRGYVRGQDRRSATRRFLARWLRLSPPEACGAASSGCGGASAPGAVRELRRLAWWAAADARPGGPRGVIRRAVRQPARGSGPGCARPEQSRAARGRPCGRHGSSDGTEGSRGLTRRSPRPGSRSSGRLSAWSARSREPQVDLRKGQCHCLVRNRLAVHDSILLTRRRPPFPRGDQALPRRFAVSEPTPPLRFVTKTPRSPGRCSRTICASSASSSTTRTQTTGRAAARNGGKAGSGAHVPAVLDDLGDVELVGEDAEAVLLGGADETEETNRVFSYMNLARLHELERARSSTPHRIAGADLAGPLLDSGARRRLEYAADVDATVVGKPSPVTLRGARAHSTPTRDDLDGGHDIEPT